jgi:hypothetical protein
MKKSWKNLILAFIVVLFLIWFISLISPIKLSDNYTGYRGYSDNGTENCTGGVCPVRIDK